MTDHPQHDAGRDRPSRAPAGDGGQTMSEKILTTDERDRLTAAAICINRLQPPGRREYITGIYVEDALLRYASALASAEARVEALTEDLASVRRAFRGALTADPTESTGEGARWVLVSDELAEAMRDDH